ncbi:MAG: hypothetical protein CMA56_00630 [Euryarchaeota archaeon]|nr:hypothetical protein [Euryarchaeota archaeon]
MEGTPQIALMMLVLGLLTWAWPRPLPNERLDDLRRWLPVAGWTWAMCSRLIAAFNPASWPHFASRLDAEASLSEQLAAVVSGDGLVLVGMAVPLWMAALDRHGDASWQRAEVVLPLALIAMLGLEGGVEQITSAPGSPTVAASGWDAFLCLLVVVLGAVWMNWRSQVTMIAAWAASLVALVLFMPMVEADSGVQAARGPGLLAASAALALAPRAFPRPSMAAPHGLALWLILSMVFSAVLMFFLLSVYGGFEAWAIIGVVLRAVTVVGAAAVIALLSLRLGLDAQAQATWTMGRRAWSVAPLLLLVVLPAVPLVAASMCMGAWTAWALLRWWPVGQENRA